MAKNSSLHKAHAIKNDEFYTMTKDIQEECSHYFKLFQGKNIYLPCDLPFVSNFWYFFHDNFHILNLKSLTASGISNPVHTDGKFAHFDGSSTIAHDLTDGTWEHNLIPTVNSLGKDDTIVITNPPFSLFENFILALNENNFNFLIMGNINEIICNEIFTNIVSDSFRLGYNDSLGQSVDFRTPDGSITQLRNTAWFTSLPVIFKDKKLPRRKSKNLSYSKELFPRFDNYDAINCDRATHIPVDYYDNIAVPISFLNYIDPDSWTLVDKIHHPKINGKEIYKRLVIRRK